MCEPRNRDNGASDFWALTAYMWLLRSYVALSGRLPRTSRIIEARTSRNCHVNPVTTKRKPRPTPFLENHIAWRLWGGFA